MWFGRHDPYIEQDESLFGCLLCNQMCASFHVVEECEHGGFFDCVKSAPNYGDYQQDLYNIFSF